MNCSGLFVIVPALMRLLVGAAVSFVYIVGAGIVDTIFGTSLSIPQAFVFLIVVVWSLVPIYRAGRTPRIVLFWISGGLLVLAVVLAGVRWHNFMLDIQQLKEKCAEESGGSTEYPNLRDINVFKTRINYPNGEFFAPGYLEAGFPRFTTWRYFSMGFIRYLLLDVGFQFVEVEATAENLHRMEFDAISDSEGAKSESANAKYVHFYRAQRDSDACKAYSYKPASFDVYCIGVKFLRQPESKLMVRWVEELRPVLEGRGEMQGLWKERLEAVSLVDNRVLATIWYGGYFPSHLTYRLFGVRGHPAISCMPPPTQRLSNYYLFVKAAPDPDFVRPTEMR